MKDKTRNMILTALFAALTAAGAFVKIPVGSVPFTLQLFFTVLSGILLGGRLGALSQLVYVLIGLAGMPVFASGGGISYIYNPAFGYLLGFILASYATGKMVEMKEKPGFVWLLISCITGTVVIYIIGVPYLYMISKVVLNKSVNISVILKTGFLIFIPGDLIKCVLTALIGVKIVPVIKKEMLR